MTNSGSTSLRWSRNGSSTAVAVARRLISHRACLLACLLAILAAGMFAAHDATAQETPAPAVSSVWLSSAPASGDTYQRGDTIEVRVDFDRLVAVTGTPRVAVTVGTRTRSAALDRTAGPRSSASSLFFKYTVVEEDSDADGISIAADSIRLNGATITATDDSTDAVLSLALRIGAATRTAGMSAQPMPDIIAFAAPATLQAASAGGGGGLDTYDFELTLELDENRDGSVRPVELGCVALAAPDRQFSYSITRGDASRFAVGATDGSLRYTGSGENAERTPEYLLTVTATPHDSGAALHLSVRIAIVDADDRVVVVLSTMQPYVGEEVIASLADPDGGVRAGSVTWQWWRRTYRGDWAVIPGATAAGYTPVAADVDHHLQARVSYRGQDGARRAASRQTDLVSLQPARRLRMLQIGLAGFGRTVAATAVQVIGQRFAPMTRPGAGPDALDLDVTLNGRSLGLSEAGDVEARGELVSTVAEALGIRVQSGGGGAWDAPSAAQLIADSAFTVGGASGHGARWGVWGSGALSRFSGDIDGFRQDGTVHSVYLGADYRFVPSALAGLAASHSALELTSASRIEGDATLEATLGTVYPYLYWMPTEWLGIWGVAGLGRGTSEFTPVGGSFLSPGFLESWLGAAGQRTELWSGGSVSLAAKSDGFVTGIRQSFLGVIERFRGGGGGDPPRQVSVHAWRARVLVEAGLESRPQDALVSGLVELGARLDGGDAEQGLGAEAGAELSYTHTGIGLGLTGRGRLLLVHEDRNIREWGASATLTWAPPNDGPGPAVSVAPAWGRPASGMHALWRDPQAVLASHAGPAEAGDRSSWLPDTVDVTVGYRLDGLELEAFGRHVTGSGDAGYRFGFGGSLEY